MNNMNDLMNFYQQMRQNPMQVLSRRWNIPQGVNMQDPNSIIQHLLNTGQVTQSQVNQVIGMQNNPMIKQLLGKR
jgi:hypothetical protein